MENTSSNSQMTTLRGLLAEITQKSREIAAVDLGYPLGQNIVPPPLASIDISLILGPTVPDFQLLKAFYEFCDGILLPDVGNGIFFYGREILSSRKPRKIPVTLRNVGPIFVFGSDGGGNMFAIREDSGAVLRLSGGTVLDGEFRSDHTSTDLIAGSFAEFLLRVLQDIDAFLDCRPGWKFIS